jgi:hypothetical protein
MGTAVAQAAVPGPILPLDHPPAGRLGLAGTLALPSQLSEETHPVEVQVIRPYGVGIYVKTYGVPPVGARVFIRTRQLISGWEEDFKDTNAVVARG